MSQLMDALRSGVDKDGFGTKELVGENSILEARLGEKGPEGGPWFESDAKHDANFVLNRYAGSLGVQHIVQAHQPGNVSFADGVRRRKGQMFQRYSLIFLVDTGMSGAIDDSEGAVLHIRAEPNEEAVVICPDGAKTVIWDSRTKLAMAAARACGR